MKANKKHILSTGFLEDELLHKVSVKHEIDMIPFIAIDLISSESLEKEIQELRERDLHVVFTSNNAVKAVSNLIGTKPQGWKLFSIEGVTSRSVIEHFGEHSLQGTAFYGEELAKEILRDGNIKQVVFFCGDLRRDELPIRLQAQGVTVKEVIVYNTIGTPVMLEKKYDAILFFSPSAVYSYVSMNSIEEHTVCFAIGNTTAKTIRNIVQNKVMIAQPPQKERVVDMVLEYYDQVN